MPDTGPYLLLALSAAAVTMGGLILSLIVRYRNFRRDADILGQIAQDDHGV